MVAEVELGAGVALAAGQGFAVREGGRTVAAGTVTELLGWVLPVSGCAGRLPSGGMTRMSDPAAVPGLPESGLGAAALAAMAALHPDVPGAPWVCRARILAWVQRAAPPAFGWEHGRPVPLAVVLFVDYLDTPVGPYREVLASQALRRGAALAGQVPFIAVDSPASVLGGRVNWALPKTTATFAGDVGTGTVDAAGEGWQVRARAGRPGPSLPVRGATTVTGPLGDTTARFSVRARPVTVLAGARGRTLGPWLGAAGRHAGALLDGVVTVGVPG